MINSETERFIQDLDEFAYRIRRGIVYEFKTFSPDRLQAERVGIQASLDEFKKLLTKHLGEYLSRETYRSIARGLRKLEQDLKNYQ